MAKPIIVAFALSLILYLSEYCLSGTSLQVTIQKYFLSGFALAGEWAGVGGCFSISHLKKKVIFAKFRSLVILA